MAYGDGDWRVSVRGTIGSEESWVNTWAVIGPSADFAVMAPILAHFDTLYTALGGFAAHLSNEWSAVGATARDLSNGITYDLSWNVIAGASATEKLPNQLAMRVSLSSTLGVNGGPFLCGFSQNANSDGVIDATTITDFSGALEDLWANLDGDGTFLGIDRPTIPAVVPVARMRLGARFDVIRRRANDLAEAYTLVPAP